MNFYFLDEVVSNILENYTNRSFVTGSMHDISTILIMWMCTYLHKKVQQIWLSHRGNCCKNLISYEIIFPQNKSVLNTRVYNERRKSLGYPVPATVSAGRQFYKHYHNKRLISYELVIFLTHLTLVTEIPIYSLRFCCSTLPYPILTEMNNFTAASLYLFRNLFRVPLPLSNDAIPSRFSCICTYHYFKWFV